MEPFRKIEYYINPPMDFVKALNESRDRPVKGYTICDMQLKEHALGSELVVVMENRERIPSKYVESEMPWYER